jgi:hypothetical protein
MLRFSPSPFVFLKTLHQDSMIRWTSLLSNPFQTVEAHLIRKFTAQATNRVRNSIPVA